MCRQSESNGKEGIIGKSLSSPSEAVRGDANKAQGNEDSGWHLQNAFPLKEFHPFVLSFLLFHWLLFHRIYFMRCLPWDVLCDGVPAYGRGVGAK